MGAASEGALTPFALKGQATYVNYIENPLDGWQEAYCGEYYARNRALLNPVITGTCDDH
jgi:hypothetical protein